MESLDSYIEETIMTAKDDPIAMKFPFLWFSWQTNSALQTKKQKNLSLELLIRQQIGIFMWLKHDNNYERCMRERLLLQYVSF